METFERTCPNCDDIMSYPSERAMKSAVRHKTNCRRCSTNLWIARQKKERKSQYRCDYCHEMKDHIDRYPIILNDLKDTDKTIVKQCHDCFREYSALIFIDWKYNGILFGDEEEAGQGGEEKK